MPKINATVVIVGILGIVFGAVLQYFGNVIANNKLKKELITELTALMDKKNTGRSTGEEQKRINDLQAQIELLNK